MTAPTQRPNVTPERLMQMAWGHAAPLMIEAAIKHRVFDVLDGGDKTAEQVATAAGISPRGSRILLDGLVGLQLLTKSNGRYKLTEESGTFLVSTKPNYRGAFFRHISDQLVPSWLKLTEIVRTGRPATAVNQETSGAAFFADFVEDIFPMSYPVAQMLGDHLGLSQATQPVSVLDLAAGSGVWGIGLAKKSPLVRVTAVDWPDVLKVTRRVAERHGVVDRFTFSPGDLLQANFGSGHQIATLGHIIHSEGEARSPSAVEEGVRGTGTRWHDCDCRVAAGRGSQWPAGLLIFAVNMLVNTEQGDTYTFGELSRWLAEAGFTNARKLESPGPAPLVLATKPGK